MDYSKYIPFHKQINECESAGFRKQTRFYPWEYHLDMLPAFPRLPKLKKFMEAIENGECVGLELTVCGKYGGICSGGNNQCRIDRGLEPHTDNRQDKFNFNYYETEEAYRASKRQENQSQTQGIQGPSDARA